MFNTDCDLAISKVKWNNYETMEKRLINSSSIIRKITDGYDGQVYVHPEYLNLKLRELKLAHEYQIKKYEEKEEQAEINRQIREEKQLEKDAATAIKLEESFKKMLDKAEKQASNAVDEQLDELTIEIEALKIKLTQAHEKSERAKSMAQQTRSGNVYVVSNIGSFGENVYKIGMTRRLEPMDRVKELGDASVPFIFDVHAMIKSDDAPTLEKMLHKKLASKRTNMINNRKEFFNVSLDEIKSLIPESEFVETAKAEHYRETLKIREFMGMQLPRLELA